MVVVDCGEERGCCSGRVGCGVRRKKLMVDGFGGGFWGSDLHGDGVLGF